MSTFALYSLIASFVLILLGWISGITIISQKTERHEHLFR